VLACATENLRPLPTGTDVGSQKPFRLSQATPHHVRDSIPGGIQDLSDADASDPASVARRKRIGGSARNRSVVSSITGTFWRLQSLIQIRRAVHGASTIAAFAFLVCPT